MQMSMFSAEEPPAKRSQLQDCARDWLTQEGTSRSPILPLLTDIAPSGWFSRTCPGSYPQLPTLLPISVRRESTWTATTDPKTGKRSWSLTNTKATKAMRSPVSWPDFQNSGMGSPTECLTFSSVEQFDSRSPSHNGDAVCSLSDILETGDVPQRYFLTAKACRGILRRAEKRGKELPTQLHQALAQVAEDSSELERPEDKTR